jgi:hypothetical protein
MMCIIWRQVNISALFAVRNSNLFRKMNGLFSIIMMRKSKISGKTQNFNPFVTKINANFSEDTRGLLDRRLGLAAGILLCAIEGKQD